MFIRGGKLRRVSESIYQEASPPADRSRPLEWRRSFNTVTFRVSGLRALMAHSINDVDLSPEPEEEPHPLSQLKPASDTIYSVAGIVDDEKTRDCVYCLAKTDEENIFTGERPPEKMRVLLRGGLAVKDNKTIRDGVFMGTLLRANYEPNRDYLCLEATIPVEQIKSLHAAIKENPNLELDVSAIVLSFSYEVDDALREWYHPRTLLIGDSTPAPIHWIGTPSDEGDRERKSEDEKVAEEPVASEPPTTPNPVDVSITLQVIGRDLAVLSMATKRISMALWIGLVVALIATVF